MVLAQNPLRALLSRPPSPPRSTQQHIFFVFPFRKKRKKCIEREKCSNPITKKDSRAMAILASVRNSYPTFAPPPSVFVSLVSLPLQSRARNMCGASERSKFQQPFNSSEWALVDVRCWRLGSRSKPFSSFASLIEVLRYKERAPPTIIARWLNEMH